VNVLCFADVEDLYEITYQQGTSFMVHLPERDIVFKKRNKLFVADFVEYCGNVLVTKAYTKGEIHRAMLAQDVLKMSGYPSLQEAIHLIQDGNIANMPMLTAEDMRRAFELHGEPVGSVRGKMTQKKVGRAVYDDDLIMDEKNMSHVMHIDGHKFLVTVCEPLQLTMQCTVVRETATVLGMTLQGQLELLRSRGFVPVRIHTDPQSAFRTLTTSFENVVIDPSGAGDYVPKVDTKIRRIKEVYRGVKSDLPWKIPPLLIKDLVAYAVSRINIRQTMAINQNVCPRVLVTGLTVDFHKELSLAFGDYCKVFDGYDNTSKSRSVQCVALYPCINVTGSWYFYNLLMKKRVRRSIWKEMITTSSFAEKMNALMEEETSMELEQKAIEEEGAVQQERIEPIQDPVETPETVTFDDVAAGIKENEDDVPDLKPRGDDESDDEAEDESEEEESGETAVRRSAHIKAGVKKPERYAMHTKLKRGIHNDEAMNEQIKAAEKAEIQ